METLEAIYTRRSIRKYKKEEVSGEIINEMLNAAMMAPSARNTQSWQFIVVRKRELLDKLAEIHPYAKMLMEAPLAILVCGDKSLEESEPYLCINCSAATQNILLAAHSLGLGSVWLGVYPRSERIEPIKELLNIPEGILPISLIALGCANEEKSTPQRFDKVKVHYEQW
jgi:nitroreductase